MTSLLSRVGAGEQNLFFFKEFVLNLLASTAIFLHESKLIFDFCLYLRFFLDLKHIPKNYTSQALLLDKQTNLFYFVANGFHEFENNCFQK